jgi:hypothetical protein
MRIRLNKKTKLSVLLYYYRNIELYLMLLDLQISKPNIILCLRGRLSRADGAKRRTRVVIPHGYLHPGKRKH